MSHVNMPGVDKKTPSPPKDEYAVKTYTPWEQFLFGIKLFAIGGLVLLAFWLFEKM